MNSNNSLSGYTMARIELRVADARPLGFHALDRAQFTKFPPLFSDPWVSDRGQPHPQRNFKTPQLVTRSQSPDDNTESGCPVVHHDSS
jgi:hypothetical protein